MNFPKGFTLIELVVVIAVIGILAAISIVSYRSIQDDSRDSSVQSDLQNLAKQLEMAALRNTDGSYPDTVVELNTLEEVKISKDTYMTDAIYFNLVPCTRNNATEFSIAAVSKSGKRFFITNKSGVREYTGTGDWVTGSTNYATMCENTLPSSSAIGSGSGYSQASSPQWREWTN